MAFSLQNYHSMNKNWIAKNTILASAALQLVLGLITPVSANAQVTISGISSGGFMATQMATIFSKEISGLGTVAGGFYYCAGNHMQEKIAEGEKNFFMGTKNLFLYQQSDVVLSDLLFGHFLFPGFSPQWFTPSKKNPLYKSLGICMQNPQKAVIPQLKPLQEKNWIDPIENIAAQKVFVYHGTRDSIVNPAMQNKIVEFYQRYNTPKENIKTANVVGGHNFPTNKKDLNDCLAQTIPYLSSCDYNLASEMIQFLIPSAQPGGQFNQNHLYIVDQTLDHKNNFKDFTIEKAFQPNYSIGAYGYLYATDQCLNNPTRCQLHVALHGCEMSDSYDPSFDLLYQKQVQKTQIVRMRSEKEKTLFDFNFKQLPTIEQKGLSWGNLKFAMSSGYAEMAETNNLMILFPQTWITEKNYPYNPKGCWDWFGFTGSNYASKEGQETKWLMDYIRAIQKDPKAFILEKRPDMNTKH